MPDCALVRLPGQGCGPADAPECPAASPWPKFWMVSQIAPGIGSEPRLSAAGMLRASRKNVSKPSPESGSWTAAARIHDVRAAVQCDGVVARTSRDKQIVGLCRDVQVVGRDVDVLVLHPRDRAVIGR